MKIWKTILGLKLLLAIGILGLQGAYANPNIANPAAQFGYNSTNMVPGAQTGANNFITSGYPQMNFAGLNTMNFMPQVDPAFAMANPFASMGMGSLFSFGLTPMDPTFGEHMRAMNPDAGMSSLNRMNAITSAFNGIAGRNQTRRINNFPRGLDPRNSTTGSRAVNEAQQEFISGNNQIQIGQGRQI